MGGLLHRATKRDFKGFKLLRLIIAEKTKDVYLKVTSATADDIHIISLIWRGVPQKQARRCSVKKLFWESWQNLQEIAHGGHISIHKDFL